MSRYTLTTAPPNRKLEITVGWDHPLQTYFAIVKDLTKQATIIRLWAGANMRELYEIEDLERAVASYPAARRLIADKLVDLYADKDDGR